MNIKTVAILGAGAVGSYVIWGLSERKDIRLGVLAKVERAARLEHGININRKLYKPEIWEPENAPKIDLLVVCLKYGALACALEDIKAAVSENTIIMSLMNGVESENIIGNTVGKAKILPALIKVASQRNSDGVVFDPNTTIGIIYGEYKAPFASDRVKAVQALFDGTGIHYSITKHIVEEIWSKFRLNVCNNLPQAILGAGVGCYRDSEHMKAIKHGLRQELEAIAKAKGIDMSLTAKASSHGSMVNPSARYSTLQDLDAHRHTEIDMFSGAIIKIGQELGIPTPYNEYTYHMIKAMEEKNDGRFDYEGKESSVTCAR